MKKTLKKKDKNKNKSMNIRLIWKYLQPHVYAYKWSVIFAFIFSGAAFVISGAVIPKVYQHIVDQIVNMGRVPFSIPTDVLHLFFILVITTVLVTVFHRAVGYLIAHTQIKVIERMYYETMHRLFTHSQKFFVNNFSGGLVAKTKRYSRSFNILFETIVVNFWGVGIQLTAIFISVFFESTLLGWLFLIWMAIFVGVTIIFVKYKVPFDNEKARMDSKTTAFFSDAITNILTVKIFSGHIFERRLFSEVALEEKRARIKASNVGNLRNVVTGFLMITIELVAMFVVLKLWSQGTVAASVVVLVQLYLSHIFNSLWDLGRAIAGVTEALTDVKEIVDIFEQIPDILDPEKPEVSRIQDGAIAFNTINFKYSDGQAVFKKFNLAIPAGQKVGLVGHSGSGKSTITSLLLRFVDVNKGSITIDGQDIRNLTQDDLRSHISYVPQDPILFHRTIEENIKYGNPRATKAQMIEAAKKARAHDFIMELPQGYKTLVGERGVKLSGGQRQRIAIARVMLEDTPILILDEATSSLDSISEHYIQEAFLEAMKDRTTLVIAHRLSTVAHLDRIIVLDKGIIIEDGTHEELLKKGGMYTELWEHQTSI